MPGTGVMVIACLEVVAFSFVLSRLFVKIMPQSQMKHILIRTCILHFESLFNWLLSSRRKINISMLRILKMLIC